MGFVVLPAPSGCCKRDVWVEVMIIRDAIVLEIMNIVRIRERKDDFRSLLRIYKNE